MAATLHCDQSLPTSATFVPGMSSVMQGVNRIVAEVAATSIPVLIVGESGTGKDVYAHLIDRLSPYDRKPLTKLNCRTLETEEFLAQLKSSLKADVEHAPNKGLTVFLDGIDELDLVCQRALLAVLPDGEDEKDGHAQVRLIASASRNLWKEIEGGRFRKELFFRISVVCVHLPALRERKEDIPLLLEHFLAHNTAGTDREAVTPSQEELALVETYDWPGNVRELENFARKISLFGQAREAIAELESTPRFSSGFCGERNVSLKAAARTASRQAERELIQKALERTHWNRKQAAKQLSVSYKSLLYKIKQTGLEGSSQGGRRNR